MAKGKKPIPKTQREISENLHTPYEVSGMQGGVLQNPNDSDYDGDKRGNHVSFKGDKVKPFSISVTDIDEAVVYYIENIIKPTVYQNNKKIMVPVLYGSSERWKQVQKDGYLRDGRNQIMLPLIMFQRTSLEPNRALTNKLDANSPNNYNVTQKSYSSKNAYSNFNVLTNRKQEKEYHTIVVPDYVTVNYDFIVSTHYVEQMNSIIEAINYAADSYWGNPERFKFKAEIDSFVNKIELPADGQRVVKTTFSLKLYGYIIPETIQKDLNSIKKISNKTQLIFGLETTQPYESLSSVSASSLSTGNVVFPGNNSCPSVLIYRNGVLYQTIAAGGEFSYNTGSGGDPIDIQINSSSFLTGVDTNQNIGVLNTNLLEIGMQIGNYWRVGESELYTNLNLQTNIPAESVYDLYIVNTNNDYIGEASGSDYFKVRDTNLRVNNVQITGARAETTKSISIVDTVNLDPIGTILQDTPTLLTIGIKNTYVSNSNGTYTQSILPETTSSIHNTYVNIYASGNLLIQSSSIPSGVTNSINVPLKVYPNRPVYGNLPIYYEGDEGWCYANNIDAAYYPIDGVFQQLDHTYGRDRLKYKNAFGNNYRFTGINGGYYNNDTFEYATSGGLSSSFAIEFTISGSGSATDGYIIDHLMGMGWRSIRGGTATWTASLDSITGSNHFGFSGWRIPTISQLAELINPYSGSSVLTPQRLPFQWDQSSLWSITTYTNPTNQAYFLNGNLISVTNKTTVGANRVWARMHYSRSQYVIQ